MEIIAQLETTPRKIYTGSIGFMAPDGRQVFNVAIRTALIDRDRGQMEYGIGGGITWDSVWRSEYDECLAKAGAVTKKRQCFELFETMLWEAGKGYFLEHRHIDRLRDSCAYFGWKFDEVRVRDVLREVGDLDKGPYLWYTPTVANSVCAPYLWYTPTVANSVCASLPHTQL